MFSALLIIYFLLFIFLALKNLPWAIYLVIFTLPAYLIRFNIFGLPSTLLEIEILLLFIIFLIKYKINFKKDTPLAPKTNYSLRPLYYFIALLLIASTVAIFVSPNIRQAAGLWKAYFIEPIIFFGIFIKTIKKEDLKNIFYVLSAQVLLLSIWAIYQKLTGNFITNPFWSAEATRRVTSVFPYPNALALYLAPLLILFLGYLVLKFKKLKNNSRVLLLFHFIILISGFLAIYYTRSKGALLAVLIGIIFYAIFLKNYRKYFVVILGIIILLSFYLFSTNKINLKGTSTVAGGDSISTRLDMWSEAWQMLKQKPIFGAGISGYQSAVAPFHKKSYIEIYLYPHNIFLNFWSEIGILGMLAFWGLIVWFYNSVFYNKQKKLQITDYLPRRQAGRLQIIFASAMTTLLIHGLVDVPYFKNDLAILFWLIIGLLVVSVENKKDFLKP